MLDTTNKKVLGKFKDEIHGLVMTEFIGLNPKCYSFNHINNEKCSNKKKLKGISKVVVKNEISHNDYINTMKTNNQVKKNVVALRSFDHQIYTIKNEKI
ncbi:MAG: hypothetical protein ACKPKO_31275, partial [Candidatus Fonsibacter sp.]